MLIGDGAHRGRVLGGTKGSEENPCFLDNPQPPAAVEKAVWGTSRGREWCFVKIDERAFPWAVRSGDWLVGFKEAWTLGLRRLAAAQARELPGGTCPSALARTVTHGRPSASRAATARPAPPAAHSSTGP